MAEEIKRFIFSTSKAKRIFFGITLIAGALAYFGALAFIPETLIKIDYNIYDPFRLGVFFSVIEFWVGMLLLRGEVF